MFVYMYHHKIEFYDKISKLGLKGQGHIQTFFAIPILRHKFDAMSYGGFQVALQF